ncbi:non-ribosomal peptide synthetase, partial [Bacillus paramobilis]|uniref:non-ribosomal peptide synthetase n=2 Tax=Bacillaceae TaxID=186817 RepID=UPI001BB43A87
VEAETGKRVLLKEILSNPTVENLAEIITGKKAEEYMPIPTAEIKAYYPMSSTQKRIYLLNQIDENGTAYNMPQSLKITGDIRINDLKTAVQSLIDRHEILRSIFVIIDGEPVQKIKETMEVDFTQVIDERTDQKELMDRFIRPFNLSEGPLVRMEVIKRKDGYLLFIDMHHIISDGMSMGTLTNELMALYNKENVEPLTHQYKDYSEWMRSRDLSGQKEYWMNQFEEEAPILDMPLDYIRSQHQSFAGASVYEQTGKELALQVKKFAQKNKVTEYMVFLSAAMILLGKYSRQQDIIIGSPISARTHKDTENMLGMFVNTLAMRGRPEGQKTYRQFLEEIKETCLQAYENQEYPFEELVEEVTVHRDMSRNPLFDVMLVLQNNESIELDLNGSKVESTEVEFKVAKFDLTFSIYESENTYQIALEYCTDLYKKESAERLLMRLISIIYQIVSDSTIKIDEIDVITKEERTLITENFNDTYRPYPKEKTVVELFEEQVEKTPNHIAVTFEDEEITYKELNRRANALAHKLRSLGVKPDDCVAIMAERSIEMIVGIYGIIKAGGAYVPIDPTNPKDRIEYMLADCMPKAILTYKAEVETEIPVIDFADRSVFTDETENPEKVNQSSDLLYVMYTSGTTGKPKGTMIEHKSVIRLVKDTNYIAFDENTVILQTGSMSFDASTFEMWGAFLNGGTLVLTNSETITNVGAVKQCIQKHQVNTMLLTTMLYNQMIVTDAQMFNQLKYLLIGGEKLSEEQVRILKSQEGTVRLINGYGPTENTTLTTTYE